jgi:hypothetical protein
VAERGETPDQVVIVLLNVDDENGRLLSEVLMPGYNWQEIRDKGEVPFARGLAVRECMQEALDCFDTDAALKLRSKSELAVVVVDFGVAEIFTA